MLYYYIEMISKHIPAGRLFLRLFLFTTIVYSLFSIIADQIIDGEVNLSSIIFKGVFFGLFFSVFFVGAHLWKLQEAGVEEFTMETIQVKQARDAKSKLNLAEIVQLIRNDKYLKRSTVKESANEVLIHTRVNWKSWGERIRIRCIESAGSYKEYKVESMPRFGLTMVDFGQNLQNVKRVLNLMEED